MKQKHLFYFYLTILIITSLIGCTTKNLTISKKQHIVLIGNNLCSRMMNFGHFETEMHLRYPDHQLFIRNMCDGGNTAGFRPHLGRFSPWAFPDADKFQTELTNSSNSQGHFETPDQSLTRLKADIILAFFGYNESFEGVTGLANFEAELKAFIQHTSIQKYNGQSTPQLVLVSPIAFQDLSYQYDLPDGKVENKNLKLYTEAMQKVAKKYNVPFIDVFTPTQEWFKTDEALTIDGFQLNDKGYQKFATYLVDKIFGTQEKIDTTHRSLVLKSVLEKNWFWHNDFKSPNGVHVFGKRYNTLDSNNYPDEIKKNREMTAIRDQAIWKATKGKIMDLAAADAKTRQLSKVKTSFKPEDKAKYLYGKAAETTLKTPKGYKVELFASKKEFPDLANPVQLSFDNKGRLWVAVMPTYPHYRVGDSKPNDKLLILEDTDGDNKADKQTIFVDNLHMPVGFEFAPEGVYIAQGTNLKLYMDTNGDDKADKEEIILSGFDNHHTHHTISAFCADPSGAIFMSEGTFLHTNVETPYGPIRATNGGFFRYSPQRKHLERTAQIPISNPSGIAFDEYGQRFFAEIADPEIRWMLPSSIRPHYGQSNTQAPFLEQKEDKIRPTSGLEFVSSRHFPDDVQGDLLVNNSIGFLGMQQYKVSDNGTGFRFKKRQDLITRSDSNFCPVDMEFAPDGSLYFLDWYNSSIGHIQHNARDSLQDHAHGRIYRITYPSRPLVKPAKIAGASIPTLLNNLRSPEYRTRYRTHRELRGRNRSDVIRSLGQGIKDLDKADKNYERYLLEALWVSWGVNAVNPKLLEQLLGAKDFRIRAAAVQVLRYSGHQVKNQAELLHKMASDKNSRVRLEVLAATSWLDKENGLKIIEAVAQQPMDIWLETPYKRAIARLKGKN